MICYIRCLSTWQFPLKFSNCFKQTQAAGCQIAPRFFVVFSLQIDAYGLDINRENVL